MNTTLLTLFLVCVSLPFLGLGLVFFACALRHVRSMREMEKRHNEMRNRIEKTTNRHT